MAKRHEETKFLDVNAAMQGSLIFSEPVNLRINGKFEGTLKAKGSLIVGEGAMITADIDGEQVIISGSVRGKIKSSRTIGLTSTANVYGDVETPQFSIEEGAVFNGRCKMVAERLSLPDLAEYLAVESSKIVEWVQSGKLAAHKEGNELTFDKREVESWVAQNR
jgi:excisionase family DNA binding protein